MSECVEKESSMTGSTRVGPLKPPVNSVTLKDLDILMSSGHCRLDNEPTLLRSSSRQEATRILHKMTPVRPQSAQPVQLTPLWEHVVRTRRFPSEVDTQETFDEITDRLKDPEWEVRQHALRVLVDVLPTLDIDEIDDAMANVFPQLVNNLGHLAPAVRKGAIDTLRVYLVCSRKKEDIVKEILNDGLLRQDSLDIFHSNITLGVILSVPSLLFPSSSNSRPSDELIRQAIGALANRLVQVTHQEASLRSLVKIQELLGSEDFYIYLNQLDVNAKRDYDILCNVYKIKPSEKNLRKQSGKTKKKRERNTIDQSMTEDRNSDKSKNAEEKNNDEIFECGTDVLGNEENIGKSLNCSSSESRIVLETEIKFNEETAITMTIIEREDEDIDRETYFDSFNEFTRKSEDEIPLEIKYDIEEAKDNEIIDEWIEKRKTPRRVHFGGEIVKLRTPDSDDSEIAQTEISQSKIPIPVSTTTKTTAVRPRKSRSNPCSPNVVRSKLRKTKSVSNSPKREFYIHDASLSPKKSILMKSTNNTIVTAIQNSEDCKKKMEAKVDTFFGRQESDDSGWAFEIYDNDDFLNTSQENIDYPIDSTNPKNNHESKKKKRNFGKTIDYGSNTSLEKIDSLKNSANAMNNEESSRKRSISLKANEKIGKTETNEKSVINDEYSSKVFPDSNLERIASTKKLSSAKKRRNSSKTTMEKTKTSEIDKIEIDANTLIDNANDFNKNSIDLIFDTNLKTNDSIKGSTDTNDNCESAKKNQGKMSDEFSQNNKISEIQKNDSFKVKSAKSAEGSRVTLESSKSEFLPEKKHEEIQVSRVPNDGISVSLETRQVEENFESTNERNSKSSSLDLQNRVSPHSPRKHVFETFPRKERNYILMELASPVKTNSRKMSENFENKTAEEQTHFEVKENYSSLTGENSQKREDVNDLEVFNNFNNENSIAEEIKEKNDKTKTANETMKDVKKCESFDSDESPLKNIVITEITKFRESNWEDLGLVDQEVLDDLHNKDDWRARVRGLERVASALRTSSALIAIEPRLGSLLHAVLGGERSCRVAAAGMAVARVVVAGVSEEALKRRLPQVAWGLARQGGPNAAQLARVAMLRLRPALLLEQLLQPHCIKARNAKTRENALQLLIFSLVTFPSTEFKVEKVAYKVACMVGDKRRRVRQAALDTLAVLAQIYEPEEVMKASKMAGKGQQDGDAMLAAIRARLARKSLPMVSADGLVLYGLQISPTIQIATGPDVDWIIAGSGSVSPGTGRTRGQIIATTPRQGAQEKNSKKEFGKNSSSTKGPNFVALGVGLETKNEQKKPLVWQLVQHLPRDESRRIREKSSMDGRDENFVGSDDSSTKSRLTGTLRHYRSATDRLDDSYASNDGDPIFLMNDKDVIMKQRKTEEIFHRRMDEIYAERVGAAPTSQDNTGNRLESRIPVLQSRDRETNGKDTKRIGAIYPRRRLLQEGNNLQNWSAGSRISDISRPQSTHRDDHSQTDINTQRYEGIGRESSQQMNDNYRSIYRQGRGFADGNVYREVQTAPTTTSYDVTRRRQSLKDTMAARYVPASRRIISEELQASTIMESNEGITRTRGHKGDKSTVEEEDYNEINKCHFSVQTNLHTIQNSNDQSSQCSVPISSGPPETSSNESSNVSEDYERSDVLEKLHNERNSIDDSFVVENNDDVLVSPVKSPIVEKSFNVISNETNPSRRNSVDFAISSQDVRSNTVCTNEIDESEKDSSIEEVSIVSRIKSSHEKFSVNRDDENDSSEIEEKFHGIDCNIGTIYVMNETNSSDDGISKISDDSPISNESQETEIENENPSESPARVDSSYAIRSIETVAFVNSSPSTDENDQPDAVTVSYVSEYPEVMPSENVVREISQCIDVDESVRSEFFLRHYQERRESNDRDENIAPIVAASRPHSQNSCNNDDKVSIESFDFRQSQNSLGNSIVGNIHDNDNSSLFTRKLDESTNLSTSLEKITADSEIIEQNNSRESSNLQKIDRSSNTGNENVTQLSEVIGSRASTSEKTEVQKRAVTSRISRNRRASRTNAARVGPMQPNGQPNERNTSKSRTLIQQCFTQLESNDWEVTMKGLKGLSQIARQQPEQLDSFAPGTVGRLLGRHVRNLRSQVSRAACLAAGDVFGSHARCIDQDLDDIAGPLLHRTADTNKFLRADSNEALDRMVEHLPPHKTIAVIVHRGATHQNAIVRATTARLLASIVDRIGPDHIMSMSREVREKLIATGAKLLMDGNLDARNHTKRIFRELSRYEGFRKVLKDSVPESTLRHIDKTLRSLK